MTEAPSEETRRYSRSGFLKRTGAGAGALALSGGGAAAILAPPAARSSTVSTSPTTFGRIFEKLPPFAPATDAVRHALRELGAKGGPLDAKDDLAKGPVLLITDPSLSVNNPNNPSHTAGTTFFGQFVDHDITFDTTSPLGVPTEPSEAPNSRTPSLDLDSVYGHGPVASSQLYDPADRAKLRIESGGQFEDLARTSDNTAIIPDPRNDENLVIAGLQCAFIRFHNNAVDWARDHGFGGMAAFAEARRLTTWHYHWLVLHEFLPLIVGQKTVDDVLRKRRFYRPRLGQAFMPVEFQAAAYRFGHSMARHGYDLKKSTPLWFYVLREAEVRADGLTLGPVGGRIVAEVLVGLIESDPGSFLVQEPRWRPTLTSAGAGFRMVDFLRFAGVDPASRGQ
jgi:hypothetical protein